MPAHPLIAQFSASVGGGKEDIFMFIVFTLQSSYFKHRLRFCDQSLCTTATFHEILRNVVELS